MGNTKRCYNCSTEVDEDEKICPRCKKKLGAKGESGIAKKPGSLMLKIFFVLLLIAIAGKFAGRSSSANSAAAPASDMVIVKEISNTDDSRDGVIKKLKEKGAQALGTLGVVDIGYNNDDALCVYVDPRFGNLTRPQQEQLVRIMADEWAKALGKDSTAVVILEYDTKKKVDEWTVK